MTGPSIGNDSVVGVTRLLRRLRDEPATRANRGLEEASGTAEPGAAAIAGAVGRSVSEEAAETELWRRLAEPVRRAARQRLGRRQLAVADEDDVCVSVFRQFFHGVREGRYEAVRNTPQARGMLRRMAIDKTIDLVRFHTARRRRPEGGWADGEQITSAAAERFVAPEEVVADRAELEALIAKLSRRTLQRIATMKLQGYTNEEIAGELGCAKRTVERKLAMIRRLWGDLIGDDASSPRSSSSHDAAGGSCSGAGRLGAGRLERGQSGAET